MEQGSKAWSGSGPLRMLAFLLLGVGLALLAYARFNAVNGVVLPFLQRAATPELYALDDYIRQSIVPGSTPLFGLLARWGLDLTTPGFIVVTYLLVTMLSGLAVWRILGRSFGVEDPLLRAALLFALAFADSKIFGFNKSSWMVEHNFSFTFLAAALRMWFLAFLLEGRLAIAAALLVPINILSFKVGWPAVGFVALALIGLRSRSPLAWGLLAVSLLVPGWAALQGAVHLAPDEKAFVFSTLNGLHPGEDNPFAGPLVQVPLFLGGLVFAVWRLRHLPRALAVPVGAVLVGSTMIWLAGGLYLTFGGQVFPLPLAVLLSPARAMELAALLIYLLVLLWIATAPGLGGVERVVFALAAITLKVTPDGKFVVVPLVLVALGLIVLGARRLALKRGFGIAHLGERLPLSLGVAALAPVLGLFFALNVSGQRTTYRLDPVLAFYDAAIPADALRLLRAAAAEPGDRRILVVSSRKGWATTEWNYLARKSGILGDPYYLALPEQIRVQAARNAIADEIVAGLRSGRVDAATAVAFAGLNATLAVPGEALPVLVGWREVGDYGTWKEMAPPVSASLTKPIGH